MIRGLVKNEMMSFEAMNQESLQLRNFLLAWNCYRAFTQLPDWRLIYFRMVQFCF
jgi:hypothetical protein